MDKPDEADLCFPLSNNSCRKIPRNQSEATVIYTLLSSITVITVFLNLLVIVSIAHFRHGHSLITYHTLHLDKL
ncbi:hypothetical protein NL108_002461 [Boleophthalmus pectinirostris]|nr:hypothetical protein NL108_002461 [Boleophthalmus pectinirostris]